MRKIAVVTGTRAEYWLLRPLMKQIVLQAQLQVFASGMHLSSHYGHTIEEIKKDFSITDTVDMRIKRKNTTQDMANSLSLGISGFVRAFTKHKPDIIVVLGDRIEPLAASLAATFLQIPVAHLHGGELSGNIDNAVRHCVTKLSHIHFPATRKNANRIISMGEKKWRVNNVGALGVESAINFKLLTRKELYKKYSLNDKRIFTVVYHPETETGKDAGRFIGVILSTTIKFPNTQTFVIYPNADAGSYSIIETIKKYEKLGKIKTAVTVSQLDYYSLLKYSAILIGNTSSGLIEAPVFNLPFINIGNRQKSRERAGNVIDVKRLDEEALKKAIFKALFDRKFIKKVKVTENPYGKSTTSKRIVDIILKQSLDHRLMDKKL